MFFCMIVFVLLLLVWSVAYFSLSIDTQALLPVLRSISIPGHNRDFTVSQYNMLYSLPGDTIRYYRRTGWVQISICGAGDTTAVCDTCASATSDLT